MGRCPMAKFPFFAKLLGGRSGERRGRDTVLSANPKSKHHARRSSIGLHIDNGEGIDPRLEVFSTYPEYRKRHGSWLE